MTLDNWFPSEHVFSIAALFIIIFAYIALYGADSFISLKQRPLELFCLFVVFIAVQFGISHVLGNIDKQPAS